MGKLTLQEWKDHLTSPNKADLKKKWESLIKQCSKQNEQRIFDIFILKKVDSFEKQKIQNWDTLSRKETWRYESSTLRWIFLEIKKIINQWREKALRYLGSSTERKIIDLIQEIQAVEAALDPHTPQSNPWNINGYPNPRDTDEDDERTGGSRIDYYYNN